MTFAIRLIPLPGGGFTKSLDDGDRCNKLTEYRSPLVTSRCRTPKMTASPSSEYWRQQRTTGKMRVQVIERNHAHLRTSLDCGRSQMRQQNCVWQRAICRVDVRLAFVHVKTGGRDATAPQRGDKSFIIAQAAAPSIYDDRALWQ